MRVSCTTVSDLPHEFQVRHAFERAAGRVHGKGAPFLVGVCAPNGEVVLSGYLSLHQLKTFLSDVRGLGYSSELIAAPASGCDVLVVHQNEG
jgi:hypothetical protein